MSLVCINALGETCGLVFVASVPFEEISASLFIHDDYEER